MKLIGSTHVLRSAQWSSREIRGRGDRRHDQDLARTARPGARHHLDARERQV